MFNTVASANRFPLRYFLCRLNDASVCIFVQNWFINLVNFQIKIDVS